MAELTALDFTADGALLLPRPFLNALMALLSGLPDLGKEHVLLRDYCEDKQHATDNNQVLMNVEYTKWLVQWLRLLRERHAKDFKGLGGDYRHTYLVTKLNTWPNEKSQLDYTTGGVLLLPRPFLDALITLLSKFPDCRKQRALISGYCEDEQHATENNQILIDVDVAIKLACWLQLLRDRHHSDFDELRRLFVHAHLLTLLHFSMTRSKWRRLVKAELAEMDGTSLD